MQGNDPNGHDQEGQLTPAFREALERQEIVEKYTKGREGQAIDPSEDPNFSPHARTDKFGFIHDEPSYVEQKLKAITPERMTKWREMYNNWDRCSSTLKARVYKGIPNEVRGVVWKKLLNVDGYLLENKDVYAQLLERARLASPEVHQIDADVRRAYRRHVTFRLRFDKGQQSLFHVLAAYSVFNTEVSYCQGMSEVAALLLMYMSEEDAFWALHALMIDDRYGMHGFYVQGSPKLLRFQKHHDEAMGKVVSSVKTHFDKIGLGSFYTAKWFLQCFLDGVPFQLALRLWDVFLLDGDQILTAMAINIMRMHMHSLATWSFVEVGGFFQHGLRADFGHTDDDVIDSLRLLLEELRRVKLLVPAEPNEKPTTRCGDILRTPLRVFEMRLREAIDAQGQLKAPNAAYVAAGKNPTSAAASLTSCANASESLAKSSSAVVFPDILNRVDFHTLSPSALRCLIASGADVNNETVNGTTPLRTLFRDYLFGRLDISESHVFELAKILIKNGADCSGCSKLDRQPALSLVSEALRDPTCERRRRCLLEFLIRSLPRTHLWTDISRLDSSGSRLFERQNRCVLNLAKYRDWEMLELLLRLHRADVLLADEFWLEGSTMAAYKVDEGVREALRVARDEARATPPSLQFIVRAHLRVLFGVDADVLIENELVRILPMQLINYLQLRY